MSRRGCKNCCCLREDLRPDGGWIGYWVGAPLDNGDTVSAGTSATITRLAPSMNWTVDIEVTNVRESVGTVFRVDRQCAEIIDDGGVLKVKICSGTTISQVTLDTIDGSYDPANTFWMRAIEATVASDRHYRIEIWDGKPGGSSTLLASGCRKVTHDDGAYYEAEDPDEVTIEITAGTMDVDIGSVKILDTEHDKSGCPVIDCTSGSVACASGGPFTYAIVGMRVVVSGLGVNKSKNVYVGPIYKGDFGLSIVNAGPCTVTQEVSVDLSSWNGTYVCELWKTPSGGGVAVKQTPAEVLAFAAKIRDCGMCRDELALYSWVPPTIGMSPTYAVTDTAGCGSTMAGPSYGLGLNLDKTYPSWRPGRKPIVSYPLVPTHIGTKLPVLNPDGPTWFNGPPNTFQLADATETVSGTAVELGDFVAGVCNVPYVDYEFTEGMFPNAFTYDSGNGWTYTGSGDDAKSYATPEFDVVKL